MEIELKYLAEEETAKKIFEDLADKLSNEKIIPMYATYYDTADKALGNTHIAVRVRKEDDTFAATCKWGGGSANGLHKREEVNVRLPLTEAPARISRELFIGTPAYDIIGIDEVLEKTVVMDFVRQEYHLNTEKSISALSYDNGWIIKSPDGINPARIPISEIEIELLDGSQDDLIKTGQELEEEYELIPCNISKLARGLMQK